MSAEPKILVRENWLTAPPRRSRDLVLITSTALLFLLSLAFFSDFFGAQGLMAASGEAVFERKEYWRLWSSLFAHADLGHLLSNAFLFLPLTYMLASHFGIWFFPVAGLLLGGLTNWLVLLTLPPSVFLIGISGVVYWMGGAWLTLYLLIDRRDRLRRRFGAALFLTLMLFVPETLKPEVSHLSHFLGYLIGILSAFVFYLTHRRRILAAEVLEYQFGPEDDWELPALELRGEAEEESRI